MNDNLNGVNYLTEYIAHSVQRFRTERGWSQSTLAELAAIPVADIVAIEGAHRRAMAWELRHLGIAFDKPISVFFGAT